MTHTAPVSLLSALRRGLAMKCPKCGQGRIFPRFLKVADHCPACAEELMHHQADDYPAYLVILILGKLIFPAILIVELTYTPPLWVHFSIWFPLIAVSAIALLQPVKGAVVALQWHLGLHDFEPAKQRRLAARHQPSL